MAFLVLGGTTLNVVSIEETEPELIGDESRSDSGALRGAITAEKRAWTVSLLDMSQTDYNSLRTLTALGAQLAVTGTALPATTVRARINSAGFIRTGSTDSTFRRGVSLSLVEV